jgi:hypothetical protein
MNVPEKWPNGCKYRKKSSKAQKQSFFGLGLGITRLRVGGGGGWGGDKYYCCVPSVVKVENHFKVFTINLDQEHDNFSTYLIYATSYFHIDPCRGGTVLMIQ